MKKIFSLLVFLVAATLGYTQMLGTKKSVILKLVSYECGDFCYIDLKDEQSGVSYTYDEVDKITNDHGNLKQIQDDYYASNQTLGRLIGKSYRAMIEYRLTDEFTTPQSGEDIPKKTGKKLKKWMINELTRIPENNRNSYTGRNDYSRSYLNDYGKLEFITDCYIIVEGSFKYESDAQNRVAELRSAGSKDAGYLWIPDYPSLSGKPFFATFFGPYHDLATCKSELKYYPKDNKFYYAKKVSMRRMTQPEMRY